MRATWKLDRLGERTLADLIERRRTFTARSIDRLIVAAVIGDDYFCWPARLVGVDQACLAWRVPATAGGRDILNGMSWLSNRPGNAGDRRPC